MLKSCLLFRDLVEISKISSHYLQNICNSVILNPDIGDRGASWQIILNMHDESRILTQHSILPIREIFKFVTGNMSFNFEHYQINKTIQAEIVRQPKYLRSCNIAIPVIVKSSTQYLYTLSTFPGSGIRINPAN